MAKNPYPDIKGLWILTSFHMEADIWVIVFLLMGFLCLSFPSLERIHG